MTFDDYGRLHPEGAPGMLRQHLDDVAYEANVENMRRMAASAAALNDAKANLWRTIAGTVALVATLGTIFGVSAWLRWLL